MASVSEPVAAPDARILTFELEIPIRWGDMDAMGHVNNTVYFRYMEQARISWFERLGLQPDPNGEGPVIINAACTFIRQFEYPGTVLARHFVGAFGRSSVETYVDMSRTDAPDVVCASGSAKVVWVDFPRQRSTPLPDRVRDLMRRPWPGK
jgi:acyl-CoA thioester hydrolase